MSPGLSPRIPQKDSEGSFDNPLDWILVCANYSGHRTNRQSAMLRVQGELARGAELLPRRETRDGGQGAGAPRETLELGSERPGVGIGEHADEDCVICKCV